MASEGIDMAGAGSRGGVSKSTFYRAWREGQERRFQTHSITTATHPPAPSHPARNWDWDSPPPPALRVLREAAGMTPTDLGRMIGVSGSYVLDFENGTRRPKEPQAEALDRVLGSGWRGAGRSTRDGHPIGLYIARKNLARILRLRSRQSA